MMMIQQERAAAAASASTPTPKKRKGKFKKSRLRLLKKDSGHHSISMPTGKYLCYTLLVIPPFWRLPKNERIFCYL